MYRVIAFAVILMYLSVLSLAGPTKPEHVLKQINQMASYHREAVRSKVHTSQIDAKLKLKRQSTAIKNMPVAGYIPWGRTHCNSTNNPQNFYTKSQHQAYVTVAYYVNEVLGGVLLNGSRYLVKDINYNDGADCTLMKIIYQRMVDVDGAKFLFAPVNPDCSVLAKFAESRGILYGNGGDYSLLFLRATAPNITGPYDEPWSVGITYDNLQWTFNLMNDILKGGQSCAVALTDPTYIDQSRARAGDPPLKVKLH